MKKVLLLLVLICFFAPAVTVSAAPKANTETNVILSFFNKKAKKQQPKFRPQSKAVFKVK
jgi:hypothetical protein